jgi:hypothetical protein
MQVGFPDDGLQAPQKTVCLGNDLGLQGSQGNDLWKTPDGIFCIIWDKEEGMKGSNRAADVVCAAI